MSEEAFKYLETKDVYRFLEGDGESNLIEYNGEGYGLPYLTASDLLGYCQQFGLVEEVPGFSRWTYVEALIKAAVANDRCDELLNFFFDLSHFNNLQGSHGLDIPAIPDEDVENVHKAIVTAAIQHINHLIRLTRHELQLINGHFYMVKAGEKSVITTLQLDKFSSEYAADLRNRCQEDFVQGNYDSVITKSRTMMEETLIHIIEIAKDQGLTEEEPSKSGDLVKLYNQVKTIKNMRQTDTNDERVKKLLGGLETIVNNIASMRNNESDAHGAGSKRIKINAREARLVMNCSMAFWEYMVSTKD